MEIDYQSVYNKFEETMKLEETKGDEVGLVIVRLAGFYAIYNSRLADVTHKYHAVKSSLLNESDPHTGKPMSAAKAEGMADASPEANAVRDAKAHVQNIEQMINALKALQKGILNEYTFNS